MLKYVTVLCVVAALCAGAPQQNPGDVQILKDERDVRPDGYSFSYDTSDGTSRQEQGQLDDPASENAALTVTGQYAYIAPDGKRITVTFTSGPNGYQPKTSIGQ